MTLSRRTMLASAMAAAMSARAAAPSPFIKRLNPKINDLIAESAAVETVASGFTWAEGPAWIRDAGFLLISDPRTNTMYRWSGPGGLEVFLKPSGYTGADSEGLREPGSNGLAVDGPGTIAMCDSGSRMLARLDLESKAKAVLCDRYEGKRFNSPNDLCVSRTGAIYFTDPPFGLDGLEKSPLRELPFCGVYRRDGSGRLDLIDDSLARPNGIALSPDETRLYVANSEAKAPIIRLYRLGPDGRPTANDTFFDMKSLMEPGITGGPDGIKVDAMGNVFAAGPGGILVLSREGELLGVIGAGGRRTPNCAFGEDGFTLFIAATDLLLKIRLKTRGENWL